jgi:acid phosphatase
MIAKPRHLLFLFIPALLLASGCKHRVAEKTEKSLAVVAAPGKIQQSPALGATLYMQTSAEYAALCLQVYREATDQVTSQALAATRNAAGEAVGAHGKPLAVTMDLDETVLDNGWYQAELLRKGLPGYDPATWYDFVHNHIDKIRLVPGAREFIHACGRLGVTVSFITNRTDDEREPTLRTLEGFGLAAGDMQSSGSLRLLTKPAGQRSGSKDARRAQVAQRYEIIALVGDNLGDFSGIFDRSETLRTAAERQALVQAQREQFGRRWFLLPNALYGEWQKFINFENPATNLYP